MLSLNLRDAVILRCPGRKSGVLKEETIRLISNFLSAREMTTTKTTESDLRDLRETGLSGNNPVAIPIRWILGT